MPLPKVTRLHIEQGWLPGAARSLRCTVWGSPKHSLESARATCPIWHDRVEPAGCFGGKTRFMRRRRELGFCSKQRGICRRVCLQYDGRV